MKTLKKGDTCRVRLHTGEVVEAVYDKQGYYSKIHHVIDSYGIRRIAGCKISDIEFCRFVGPACVPVPMEARA